MKTVIISIICLGAFISVSAAHLQFENSLYWTGLNDLVVDGDYVYCAFYNGLMVLDVSDSTNIKNICRLPLDGGCVAITKLDSLLLIAASKNVLYVVNVANLYNPRIVENYPLAYSPKDMQVHENYAYISYDSTGVGIIDISDIAKPKEAWYMNTAGYINGIYFKDSLLVLCDWKTGLIIYNNKVPTRPVPTATCLMKESYNYPMFMGDYVYISRDNLKKDKHEYYLIDISNPFKPKAKKCKKEYRYFNAALTIGDYAFIGQLESGYSAVINISNPKDIKDISNYYGNRVYSTSKDIQGHYLYQASYEDGFNIYDISDPRKLKKIGSFSGIENITNIRICGNYAICLNKIYMTIVDISDPAHPYLKIQQDFLQTQTRRIFTDKQKAYFFDANSTMWGLDLSNLGQKLTPIYYGQYNLLIDFQVKDNYLFVSCYDSTVRIYDLIPNKRPALLSKNKFQELIINIDICDKKMMGKNGVSIYLIDIDDIKNPKIVNKITTDISPSVAVYYQNKLYLNCNLPGYFDAKLRTKDNPFQSSGNNLHFSIGATLFDHYIAIYSRNGSVTFYDLTTYKNPAIVSSLVEYQFQVDKIKYYKDHIYIIDHKYGFECIDIKDVNKPKQEYRYFDSAGSYGAVTSDSCLISYNKFGYLVACSQGQINNSESYTKYYLDGNCRSMAVKGDYLYIAGFLDGLMVVDISKLPHPKLTYVYKAPNTAEDIAIENDYLYLADGYYGLATYDIKNPGSPEIIDRFYNTANYIKQVKVDENKAVLVNNRNKLIFMDLKDKEKPIQINEIALPFEIGDISFTGHVLYVAMKNQPISIYDISDLSNPVPLQSIPMPDYCYSMAIQDNYLFVSGDRNLYLLDITNPTSPNLIDSLATPQHATSISIYGDNICMPMANSLYLAKFIK
jgi:hypothetical protein